MWSDRYRVGKLTKGSLRLTVVLTFVAAAAALLPVSSWYPAVLAFLAGLLGIFSEIATRQKERLEEVFKKSPPCVDASLGRTNDGSFVVNIWPLNDVPFECDWRVVTKNNKIVSGIALKWTKIVPKQGTSVYRGPVSVDFDKVEEGYVELRFSYRSIFASDYPELTLSDRTFHPYRLLPNGELGPAEDG